MRLMLIVVVAIATLLLGIEAHHRHRNDYFRNNNYGNSIFPRPEGLYSWTRDLGRRRQCQEYAYVPPGSQVIYGQSADDILESVNIKPGSSFYDFSKPVPIGVLAPANGPCYYSNTTLNLGQTIGNLTNINNTMITSDNEIPLESNDVPLTPAEAQNLFGTYPNLATVCDGRQVIPAFPPGAVQFPGPVNVIQIFSLDSVYKVKVPQPYRNNYNQHHNHHRHHRYG